MANQKKISSRILLPEVVTKIKNLELIARHIVEGFLVGLHKSPFHGFSVEFSQHRQYMPGDSIRHIDWKVYAKTTRYYIKQYEEETNVNAYLLLDISGSMGYQSTTVNKLQYATYLAAALAYLMLKQRDAIGMATFSREMRLFLPAKSTPSYLKLILRQLNALQAEPEISSISETMHKMAEKIKRRGLILLFSDFLFEPPEAILQGLQHFRYYGHEVLVFNILDPRDASFEFGDEATFIDLETTESLKTHPLFLMEEYRKQFDEFIGTLQNQCRQMQIDFETIFTDESFDKALLKYLVKRQKLY